MSSKTRNPKKEHIRDIQKLYTFHFIAALIVCVILIGLLIASFSSIIRVDTEIGLLIFVVIIVLFLPFSLYMKFNNQNHKLTLPAFVSEKILKFFSATVVIFFFLVFAYGILVYTYGPIKPDANIFTDKTGRAYSYGEYIIFEKWQFTFILSWILVALQGIIFLPFSDKAARKWWKF